MILCIESSGERCSVAIADETGVKNSRESDGVNRHSTKLAPFINDILSGNGIKTSELEAIVISCGPGSYTGLRIGAATAKGLCYSLCIPLIAIPTLEAMAVYLISNLEKEIFKKIENFTTFSKLNEQWNMNNSLFCPVIDAKRMEIYTAIFDNKYNEIIETQALIIIQNSFTEYLEKNKIVFFGDAVDKLKKIITHPNAIFLKNIYPKAEYLTAPALKKLKEKNFEDITNFEPFYLKDFIPGIPKVKGLY